MSGDTDWMKDAIAIRKSLSSSVLTKEDERRGK